MTSLTPACKNALARIIGDASSNFQSRFKAWAEIKAFAKTFWLDFPSLSQWKIIIYSHSNCQLAHFTAAIETCKTKANSKQEQRETVLLSLHCVILKRKWNFRPTKKGNETRTFYECFASSRPQPSCNKSQPSSGRHDLKDAAFLRYQIEVN